MDMMSKRDFFSAIPTQIALGNHDLDTYKGGWIYDIDESRGSQQGAHLREKREGKRESEKGTWTRSGSKVFIIVSDSGEGKDGADEV
eukprot:scaffold18588_cov120-Skeletonema_marinoi.AAC.1